MDMRIARGTLTAIALLASLQAHAVNKCTSPSGAVTFQDTPCPTTDKSTDTGVRNPMAIKAPAPEVVEENKKKCVEWLRTVPDWRDPSSVQLSDVIRVGPGKSLNDHSTMVVRYATQVNAKNGYGGFTGKKSAFCEFDLNETKILGHYVVKN